MRVHWTGINCYKTLRRVRMRLPRVATIAALSKVYQGWPIVRRLGAVSRQEAWLWLAAPVMATRAYVDIHQGVHDCNDETWHYHCCIDPQIALGKHIRFAKN